MLNLKKFFLALIFIPMILFSNLPTVIGSTYTSGQYATGLREPTKEQEEWMAKNFPVIQRINVNSIALDRINLERSNKGLSKLSEKDLKIVTLGGELSFASSTETTSTTTTYSTLPTSVDNSDSPAFPPIRSQGAVGSCVAWATTYYQFTYENNLALGRNAKGLDSKGDNAAIFSPK